jgi:hypothetical protein
VQTTLLGLAIAIILALVSAIVAPLVVDWNHYRAPIEAEASRLTGLNVRVNGAIDARLLPSPVITLRDVDVGAAGQPAALRAGSIKLELALGPLLRGVVQATQADLMRPQISLALDRSGAPELPALSPSFHPQALSISHFNVTDGSVTLNDAASGRRFVLQKLWFDGDIVSFAGPFNGQGAAVFGDQLYGYRISGSEAESGGMRIRLGVDPSDIPLTTEFAGTLAFAHGVPHFDGTLELTRPVGAALANGERVLSNPWRATGAVKATPISASLTNVTLRYGPEERALTFTGAAEVSFGAHPHLAGKIAAMQLDVDRALAAPEVTDRPPLAVLRSFLQGFVTAAKPPLPAQIGVSIDALTVGGTSIEALQGNLNYDGGGWSLDKFKFHVPGATDVQLSGRLAVAGQGFTFSGPATLASADFEVLLKWLDGSGGNLASSVAKTFNARGDVTIASDRMAVKQLDAALDQEKIAGSLAYDWPAGKRPARLDAQLRAGELDLDALYTFAQSAGGNGFALPQEATLALNIDKATFAGADARAVDAQVKFGAGQLQIDRLSVGDLAGAKLAVSGQIDQMSSQPRGQITLDLNADALDGVSEIAAKLLPRDADALRRAAARLAPAKVHAVLNVAPASSTGSTAELLVNGNLAAMRVAVDGKASGERAHLGAASVRIDGSVDADDGSALAALFGLDRVLAVDQLPGQLRLTAAGPLNGDLHVDGKVALSGLDSTIAGTLRLTGAGAPAGQLQVQAAAGDLRPLHQAMTGQPGAAIPVTGHAELDVKGAKFSFNDIAATIGNNALRGNLAVDWVNPLGISGDIEADSVDAAGVAAMVLGLPTNAQGADASWSNEPIGSGAFTAIDGAVTFKFDRAALTPTLAASDLKGVAHFSPSAISLDDLDGKFAGGHVSGSLAFERNPDALAAHVKLDLADAAAATILGPAMNVTDGRLKLQLSLDGLGASPAALIGSLHGGAAAWFKDTQFAGLDVAAFAAARQAAGQTAPIDMGKVAAAVNAALANGHFSVPQGGAAVTLDAGAVDLNHVILQGADGSQLSLSGAADLGSAAIDARMTLSEAPPASALISARPELSVNIKGPLAAPQRTLDMSALSSWLSLSAAELQTRRIEMIEAGEHAGAAGDATHPAAPEVHSLSPGMVVESAIPPNLLAAPAPGGQRIERLQAPPAARPPMPPPAVPNVPPAE